jgi:hypothetical protein
MTYVVTEVVATETPTAVIAAQTTWQAFPGLCLLR